MKPVFIRGLDSELYKKARVESVREGITIGEWISKAIALKLKRGITIKSRKEEK